MVRFLFCLNRLWFTPSHTRELDIRNKAPTKGRSIEPFGVRQHINQVLYRRSWNRRLRQARQFPFPFIDSDKHKATNIHTTALLPVLSAHSLLLYHLNLIFTFHSLPRRFRARDELPITRIWPPTLPVLQGEGPSHFDHGSYLPVR